jgi:hypothetical protein
MRALVVYESMYGNTHVARRQSRRRRSLTVPPMGEALATAAAPAVPTAS